MHSYHCKVSSSQILWNEPLRRSYFTHLFLQNNFFFSPLLKKRANITLQRRWSLVFFSPKIIIYSEGTFFFFISPCVICSYSTVIVIFPTLKIQPFVCPQKLNKTLSCRGLLPHMPWLVCCHAKQTWKETIWTGTTNIGEQRLKQEEQIKSVEAAKRMLTLEQWENIPRLLLRIWAFWIFKQHSDKNVLLPIWKKKIEIDIYFEFGGCNSALIPVGSRDSHFQHLWSYLHMDHWFH